MRLPCQSGTGSIYASFLTGTVANAVADTHLGYSMQGYSTTFFIQDDWKVTRKLTLNLGLRHDFQTQPVERWNGTHFLVLEFPDRVRQRLLRLAADVDM